MSTFNDLRQQQQAQQPVGTGSIYQAYRDYGISIGLGDIEEFNSFDDNHKSRMRAIYDGFEAQQRLRFPDTPRDQVTAAIQTRVPTADSLFHMRDAARQAQLEIAAGNPVGQSRFDRAQARINQAQSEVSFGEEVANATGQLAGNAVKAFGSLLNVGERAVRGTTQQGRREARMLRVAQSLGYDTKTEFPSFGAGQDRATQGITQFGEGLIKDSRGKDVLALQSEVADAWGSGDYFTAMRIAAQNPILSAQSTIPQMIGFIVGSGGVVGGSRAAGARVLGSATGRGSQGAAAKAINQASANARNTQKTASEIVENAQKIVRENLKKKGRTAPEQDAAAEAVKTLYAARQALNARGSTGAGRFGRALGTNAPIAVAVGETASQDIDKFYNGLSLDQLQALPQYDVAEELLEAAGKDNSPRAVLEHLKTVGRKQAQFWGTASTLVIPSIFPTGSSAIESGVVNFVAGKAGGAVARKQLRDQATAAGRAAGRKSALRTGLTEAASEGVEEGIQAGVQEKYTNNQNIGRAVAGGALIGAAAGGVFGGTVGALRNRALGTNENDGRPFEDSATDPTTDEVIGIEDGDFTVTLEEVPNEVSITQQTAGGVTAGAANIVYGNSEAVVTDELRDQFGPEFDAMNDMHNINVATAFSFDSTAGAIFGVSEQHPSWARTEDTRLARALPVYSDPTMALSYTQDGQLVQVLPDGSVSDPIIPRKSGSPLEQIAYATARMLMSFNARRPGEPTTGRGRRITEIGQGMEELLLQGQAIDGAYEPRVQLDADLFSSDSAVSSDDMSVSIAFDTLPPTVLTIDDVPVNDPPSVREAATDRITFKQRVQSYVERLASPVIMAESLMQTGQLTPRQAGRYSGDIAASIGNGGVITANVPEYVHDIAGAEAVTFSNVVEKRATTNAIEDGRMVDFHQMELIGFDGGSGRPLTFAEIRRQKSTGDMDPSDVREPAAVKPKTANEKVAAGGGSTVETPAAKDAREKVFNKHCE